MRFACGKYVCACTGGSDDNRCAECWCRASRALPRQIRALLRSGRGRTGERISRLLMSEPRAPLVIEALEGLVLAGDLGHRDGVFRRLRAA